MSYERYTATLGQVRLHYTLNDRYKFTCVYRIPGFDPETTPGWETFAFHLGLAHFPAVFAGFAPASVVVRAGFLTAPQLRQWTTWYEEGLAEFCFRNHLPFEVVLTSEGNCTHIPSTQSLSERALVFHGGGKDSSVSGAFLRDLGFPHTWVLLGGSRTQRFATRSELRGAPADRWIVRRNKSARVRRLRVFRGHLPLNMELAFLGAFLAEVQGSRYVVASNERSANAPNLVVDGRSINHQYSKSFAFEMSFDAYSRDWLNPDTRYFSLLRPLFEVQISRLFASMSELHYGFTSCNRGVRRGRWCCRCAKCAFVFLALYPWMETKRLTSIFGRNLLDRPRLVGLYRRLTGVQGSKPFECVGTVEETAAAMLLAARNSAPPFVVRHFISNERQMLSCSMPEVQQLYDSFDDQHLLPAKWEEGLRKWVSKRLSGESASPKPYLFSG